MSQRVGLLWHAEHVEDASELLVSAKLLYTSSRLRFQALEHVERIVERVRMVPHVRDRVALGRVIRWPLPQHVYKVVYCQNRSVNLRCSS